MSNLFLSTTEAPRFSVGTLAGKTLLAAFGAGTGLLVAGYHRRCGGRRMGTSVLVKSASLLDR
jgi:hypothetical protein